MTQGARPHPDTLAAVDYYLHYRRSKEFITIGEVAARFKIDRTTLSKALKKKRNGRK